MELKKCKEGHYYDASIYSECPTCQNAPGAGNPAGVGKTLGLEDIPGVGDTLPAGMGTESFGKTMSLGGGYQPGTAGFKTAPVSEGLSGSSPVGIGGGKTIGIVAQQLGMDPVTGWLVSVSGPEKGRDYRIHSDNNFIGRGEKMDICIRGDETISRERHAVIAYDTRENLFYFAPGEGRSISRVNGKAARGMVTLEPYDEIEIGCTKLVFIPFCGERFEWQG